MLTSAEPEIKKVANILWQDSLRHIDPALGSRLIYSLRSSWALKAFCPTNLSYMEFCGAVDRELIAIARIEGTFGRGEKV